MCWTWEGADLASLGFIGPWGFRVKGDIDLEFRGLEGFLQDLGTSFRKVPASWKTATLFP